jgi:hypothetical protein
MSTNRYMDEISDALTKAAEQAIEDALGEWDMGKAIEDAVGEHDFDRAIESALEDVDWSDKAGDAIKDAAENYDYSDQARDALEAAAKDYPWGDEAEESVREAVGDYDFSEPVKAAAEFLLQSPSYLDKLNQALAFRRRERSPLARFRRWLKGRVNALRAFHAPWKRRAV